MLERVWRKGNPPKLLMGMFTATVDNSMEVPEKLKIKLPYDPVIPFMGIYLDKTIIRKDVCSLQHYLQ